MAFRFNAVSKFLKQSFFVRRGLIRHQAEYRSKSDQTVYALCWLTLPGAIAYKAKNKNLVWAPFYPYTKVRGAHVEIGDMGLSATRFLARLWRYLAPSEMKLLASARLHGLPRPVNLKTLGFSRNPITFMHEPALGVERARLKDNGRKDREALFLLRNYLPGRDRRIAFIAAQCQKYTSARIIVTQANADLDALRMQLQMEECLAPISVFAPPVGRSGVASYFWKVLALILGIIFWLPQKLWYGIAKFAALSKKFLDWVAKKAANWPIYYRKLIFRLPNSVARLIPGPTTDLLRRMDIWCKNSMELMQDVPVELVHSHDLISAPTGAGLASRAHASHFVDVNEFPLISMRVGSLFQRMNRRTILTIEGRVREALQHSDGCIAYSIGVARLTSRHYGVPTLPLRNFHTWQKISKSTLRSEWNIPKDHIALVHVCTISPDYRSDILVRLLAHLPDRYHLVLVGGAVSNGYVDELIDLAKDLEVGHRLHLKGEINTSDAYLNYIAGAELGVVVLKPDVPNIRFGLANRHTDLFAAELPIVSTHTVESARILRTAGNGSVVRSLDPTALAQAIVDLREDPERWTAAQKAAKKTRRDFTWEEEIKRYPGRKRRSRKNRPKPIATILFQRGLVRNKRILRLGLMLQNRGYRLIYLVGVLPDEAIMATQPEALFLRVPTSHGFDPVELNVTRQRLDEWQSNDQC